MTKSLTLKAAAQQALTTLGAPAHADEIAKEILQGGYLKTSGVTLPRTINARISVDLRDRGNESIFVRTAPGIFGLRDRDLDKIGLSQRKPIQAGTKTAATASPALPSEIAREIAFHNQAVAAKLLISLQDADHRTFTALFIKLLTALGFSNLKRSPYSPHRVIDLRASLVVADALSLKFAARLLQQSSPQDLQTIQQIRSALRPGESGLLVSTATFSPGAIAEAARAGLPAIILLDGHTLAALLVAHQIGVSVTHFALTDLAVIKKPRTR